MGIRRNDYIIVGVNIGYGMYDDDQYEEVYEEFDENRTVGEMTYLIDSYGKYFIVGEVLQADKEGYNGLNFDMSTLDKDEVEEIKSRVRRFIYSNFGMDVKPNIIIKTHWT